MAQQRLTDTTANTIRDRYQTRDYPLHARIGKLHHMSGH